MSFHFVVSEYVTIELTSTAAPVLARDMAVRTCVTETLTLLRP